MLAEKNAYIADTIVTLHELSDDEKIQQQCEAREQYNWDMAAAWTGCHTLATANHQIRYMTGICNL